MAEVLRKIIAHNRAGRRAAIPSVCSAHPVVLAASLALARDLGRPIVIEATSNQVNQDGGYTGLTPLAFLEAVRSQARGLGLQDDMLVFGGDHLGPQVWRKGPAEQAMEKARVMVADYAAAGFTKIHLDCSEGCMGEPAQLGDELAAARAADLTRAALDAAPNPDALLFVIGTEVPPPGGARADEAGDIAPTTPENAVATLAAHAAAFDAAGLGRALPQVGGLVVQPGVEFSPMAVHHLPMSRDPGLAAVLADWPGLCLEAHSTDYQQPNVYPRLAELGFAFQKVGPALTFAYRQALYALDAMARQLGWARFAGLPEVMERLMQDAPGYWQGHYRGDAADLQIARHFGLADRIRYYWPNPAAQAAVRALHECLKDRPLPGPLLAQYFAADVCERATCNGETDSEGLVQAQVQLALMPYFFDTVPAAAGERHRK